MYAATELRTAAAAPKKGPTNIAGTFNHMWRLMIVVLFYWLLMWGSCDLMQGFFRSMVECGAPARVDGKCPVGSVANSRGDCKAVPKNHLDWSGSAHCADKMYVTQRGTATNGKVQCLGNVAMILSQVFVGAALLDTLGRKPVLLMGLASTTLFSGILWFSCHFPTHIALSTIILGIVVCKLADSFTAAAAAMVADLSDGDRHVQGLGFAAMNMLKHAGIVVAFAGGFPILSLYLEDYTMVWGATLVLSCSAVTVAAVVLRESFSGGGMAASDGLLHLDDRGPPRRQDQIESGGAGGTGAPTHAEEVPQGRRNLALHGAKVPKGGLQMVNVMAETAIAFRAVWDDGFLRGCMVICFLSNCATYGSISISCGFGLEIVKLRQQVVSLAGVFQPVAVMLGSYSAAYLLDNLGEVGTYLLGTSVVALGLFMIGACAHFRAWALLLFWAGLIICGLGFGLMEPSMLKLVSRRISKSNSGKIFSAKFFMDSLGVACGTYVWSNFLFGASDSGDWSAGMGMFVSAGVTLGVFVGVLMLYTRYLL